MQHISSLRHHTQFLTAAVLLLICSAAAYADTFSDGVLQFPKLLIGSATYSGSITGLSIADVIAPAPELGGTPNGSEDTYDPATQTLFIPSVIVAGEATPFTNVSVTLAHVTPSQVIFTSVTGADSYSGGDLSVAYVQDGGTIYDGVKVAVALSDVARPIAGGMPTAGPDTYNSNSNQLAIPAVQVGSYAFTNVVVTPGALQQLPTGQSFPNQESTLHSFCGADGGVCGSTDGAGSVANVIQASDGNFYGTTYYGGTYGVGTVFGLSPDGGETVLHSFTGGSAGVNGSTDGGYPSAALVQGADGVLYGTTLEGGANSGGTAFRITLAGSYSVLYSFCSISGCEDGNGPRAPLIQGGDGNFYGVTSSGGNYPSGTAAGTVFQLTPAGVETVLYTFKNNGGDASGPYGPVTEGSDGNFYGGTATGGAYANGAIYQVTAAGTEKVLYSFCAGGGLCTDGQSVRAGLIEGTDGNFYGTTSAGGAFSSGDGGGTVYKLTNVTPLP